MWTALVTGVSRRAGIGFAIAFRPLSDGFTVVVHHYSPHDARQPWGRRPPGKGARRDHRHPGARAGPGECLLNTVNPGPVDTGYATGAVHTESGFE